MNNHTNNQLSGSPEFWRNKILAFLHDPPEKAYDYGPNHLQRAKTYASSFGLDMRLWQTHHADWSAAAADRFIFPDGRQPGVGGLGGGLLFKHPLSGQPAFSENDFPTHEEAERLFASVLPDFQAENPQTAHWLLWRLWMHRAAEKVPGNSEKSTTTPYLPADTRIPDGTIWHHNAIVSALEAARADGRTPALLLFQIGPVQEFIAQARSTRDLWSGSFMLSWLMAHALQAVADHSGPDCVVFPSLRGQPLLDWLNKTKLQAARHAGATNFWNLFSLEQHQDLVLTPNLPNRFLAIVPDNFEVKKVVEDALIREWSEMASKCKTWLEEACPPADRTLWDLRWKAQTESFLQISWQLWPWRKVDQTMELLRNVPAEQESIRLSKAVAESIPDNQKDGRCYRDGQPDDGWAWSAHYQLLSHRLDARRQTRDFQAAAPAGIAAGVDQMEKDSLSGREEVVADRTWIAQAQNHSALRHLFRKSDRLGVVNLVKRVWHKVRLGNHGFDQGRFAFASVPAIAAAPWKAKVVQVLLEQPGVCASLLHLKAQIEAAESLLDFDLPSSNKTGREWLAKVDAAVFQEAYWNNLQPDGANQVNVEAAQGALRGFLGELNKCGIGKPSCYFAVLALDGDQIGKWLSGEKTPKIGEVLTDGAAKYFRTQLADRKYENKQGIADWLGANRPLSPSYHLQFSESLANFALYAARRIVEAHYGQLIYAGGDDVLAMLPADEAIACAQGLRMAFQGDSKLPSRYPGLFSAAPEGFIRLADRNHDNQGDWNRGARRPSEPSWPLLVPGPKATISVGLAIGHIKEPLQDLVQEAQAAEKRAKAPPGKAVWPREPGNCEWESASGWDRDAVAATLFKRSGESIQWGAKFDSKAFALLQYFQLHYRQPVDQARAEMPISGKLPYRIAEMLGKFGELTPVDADIFKIAMAELVWAINRQTHQGYCMETETELKELRQGLTEKCRDYLAELRDFTMQDASQQEIPVPRPLSEFYHLFALEAFINRQGE